MDEAAERIYELVEDALGVACGCDTGSRHGCLEYCHTWRRAGDAYSARVMVWNPASQHEQDTGTPPDLQSRASHERTLLSTATIGWPLRRPVTPRTNAFHR